MSPISSPLPGTCRRRSIFLVLILVFIPAASIYYSSLHIADFPYYQFATHNNYTLPASKHLHPSGPLFGEEEPLCKPSECMQGSWVPRDPPFRSLADFRKVYPTSHRGIFNLCGSEEPKREQGDRDKFHKAQEERLIRTTSWVWKPDHGRMRKWNAIEFVVRLLKSPGGLIFSGDSITRQQFNWLEYALARADIHITEDPPHLPSHSHQRLHQFILRPKDPMTRYLQDLADVPDSRLQRPIYTKIDNHILIGEKEVREFSGPLGAKENFTWYDIFDYFEGWESFVLDAARAREGEGNVTEDTILVLNTGPHWARSTWYMLPTTQDIQQDQSRVTIAFKKMVELVSARLEPIPRLSIYYRATAPGHPACPASTFYKSFRVNSTITIQPGNINNPKSNNTLYTEASTMHTEPYTNTTTALLMTSDLQHKLVASTQDERHKIARSRWDWDRFEAHNAIWKEAVHRMTGRSTGSLNGAKWFYMDIWNMALQRPDAHSQNLVEPSFENYDCLHWCVPSVVEQWTEYLNHLVFLDE